MKKLIYLVLFIIVAFTSYNLIHNQKKAFVTSFVTHSPITSSCMQKDLFFLNSAEGWKAYYEYIGMFREDMVLYRTKDGGRTWVEIADSKNIKSTLPGGVKTGMVFISSTKGWITSNAPWDGRVSLYTTLDGGITWSMEKIEVPNKFRKSAEIDSYPPLFFSPSIGILLTFPLSDNKEYLFYITNNGGKSWIPIADRSCGVINGIKWNYKAAKIATVTYNNVEWTFETDTWVRKVL